MIIFDPGSGMERIGNTEEDARRNVICQVLTDISNFIVSPLSTNGNRVNIWVRNISELVDDPVHTGVGGLATPFYVAPSGAPTTGGILDNEIWKTIISGNNSYTGVASPLISTTTRPGVPANYYHGMMAFNFSNPGINWNTDLTAPPDFIHKTN